MDNDIKKVQDKILTIIKHIDALCRENNITYHIICGTALGAVRHGGFIPWDDDLDIFMTPNEYEKFKVCFETTKHELFVIQEWRTSPKYLEYAKVRMNGTTLIESNFKDRTDMHHGIYVDIMILHKAPMSRIMQRMIYCQSKFVTLYALSQRNWRPKTRVQSIALNIVKRVPAKMLSSWCYRNIYRYDGLSEHFVWCYFITPAKFKQGIFEARFFTEAVDIQFEDTVLLGSKYIKEYLTLRYGDYMKLPSKEEQKAAVHAEIWDTEKGYEMYIEPQHH